MRNETVDDVVRDMREYAEASKVDGGAVNVWDWLSAFADRIDGALNRGRAKMRNVDRFQTFDDAFAYWRRYHRKAWVHGGDEWLFARYKG